MIPTALEFQLIKWKRTNGSDPIYLDELCESEIAEYMIEFAQMHVEAALQSANENVRYDYSDIEAIQELILNAYHLTNIK